MRVGSITFDPGRLRTAAGRVPEWLLLTGNRLAVSAVLLLLVAIAVGGLVASGLAPLRASTPIQFLVFALISGNFVLISIVVSLNQFVLNRHLESPDEIRSRMDEMLGYRREVGESSRRDVLPITQAGFLVVLFQTIAREVRDIQLEMAETADELAQDELWVLTNGLETHIQSVLRKVDREDSDHRGALFEVLDGRYSSYIYLSYHIDSEHGSALTPDVRDSLSSLNQGLEQIDVARRFFKTVFIQSELASLSRLLLYIGLPVQLLSVLLMLAFTTAPGNEPSTSILSVVIPAIVVFGFAPIVILAAYIFRLSAVAERTAAMFPFTSEPQGLESLPDVHRRVDLPTGEAGTGDDRAEPSWDAEG
jgi:hypothetical protein